MKELRAFFEMTGLTLLPLAVLFLAAAGPLRPARETSPETALSSPAASAAAPATEKRPAEGAAPPPTPVLPAAVPPSEPPAGERAEETGAEAPAEAAPEAAPEPAAEAGAPAAVDAGMTVDILFGSRVETMTLRDYLLGVVAAEMPAAFEPAALEAQAVAARTDTLYRLLVAKPHREAACCVDPGCCKAYLSPEELRRRWGEDYDRWAEKIAAAVDATDGEVLTWEGEPIFAAFHACSAGRTEASEDVWVAALPYLRSVTTPETAADVPSFRSTVRFGTEELRQRLEDKVPGAVLPEDPARWLAGERRSETGRLLSVEAGGVTLSGTAFRMLLGLRSTAVSWTLAEGVFTFETEGYGHGVGLSQYGAEVMARAGESCEDILLHYYTGAALSGLGEVFPG
jgi:stage II sporulation protein D